MSGKGDEAANTAKHRTNKGRQEAVGSPGEGMYVGTIVGYLKGNEYYKVKLIGSEGRTHDTQCVWAAGFFSTLLGFTSNFSPQVGSEALIYFPGGKLGYIVGGLPSSTYIDRKGVNRRITTGGKSELENAQYANQGVFPHLRQLWHKTEKNDNQIHSNRFNLSGQPAGDLAEGELDFTNQMGVGLQMIRHFAIMKAGDFAK